MDDIRRVQRPGSQWRYEWGDRDGSESIVCYLMVEMNEYPTPNITLMFFLIVEGGAKERPSSNHAGWQERSRFSLRISSL